MTKMLRAMAPTPPGWLDSATKIVHYAFPCFVFVYFLVALAVNICTLQTRRLRAQDQNVRRNVILGLIFAVTTTYLAEVVNLAIESTVANVTLQEDRTVYLIASAITFGVQTLALTDSKFPVWYPYYVTWFIGFFVEFALLIVPNVFHPPKSIFDYISTSIEAIRVCMFIVLPSLYFGLRNDKKQYDNADAERQSLLRKRLAPKAGSSEESTGNSNGYGTAQESSDTANSSDNASEEDGYLEFQRRAQLRIDKRLEQDGNWFTYAKGFSVFFPYLWPTHSRSLQLRALLVGCCLLVGNALGVLVPRQMGIMIDGLTKYESGKSNPQTVWMPIVVYTILRFVSGGAGIGWIRRWLWIPLEQYSYDALSTAAHSHIMGLSSDFHDSKTTSELSQALNGGRSVTDLVETVCFEFIPMFIDLTLAFGYLWSLFGPYMGLMIVVTVVSYMYTTTKLYARRAPIRRDYITLNRKEWTIGQQSLDGWSTASLFNMIPHEEHKFDCAVKDHLKAKKSYEISYQIINAAQALVMALGVLGALWLGAWQVVYGNKTVGNFTTLISYWAQLQAPLTFFSAMYKQISYSLMDAERLLELMQTKPTITDVSYAKPLKFGKGLITFDRVSFAYDERKQTLKNVSFEVPPGKTVALVGETGGGKSTILKLVDRFYDVQTGSISIDNQDVRDVTLRSLRDKIGVVPQDPMLFNDSIMNNIRYARLSAADTEVYEACKAAAVHDKIMSFPDGYNSKVGDRGVKLSGGEKQRVAIARAILKQPDIILLDEATSAVDTETEQLIQEGFKTLCQGRTTFIVAHRLSTIMKADHIIVIMNGEIVEQGSHAALIHSKGKYQDLWSKQTFVEPAAMAAHSRSHSPQKRDATIINDLTPNRGKIELAKALKTIEHNLPDDSKADGGTQTDDCNKPEFDHIREGSKLKPEAPEFVPTLFNANPRDSPTKGVSDGSPSKSSIKEAVRAQKQREKDDRKAASLARKAGKKMAKQTQDSKPSTADESLAGLSGGQITDAESSAADKSRPKRVRFSSRRNLAKSEPPNRSFDGQQDDDSTAVSSNEVQPLTQNSAAHRRRVSAPNDPPAQESRGTRQRRNRHWRLKNRVPEGTRLREASAASVDETPRPPASSPVGERSQA